MSIEWDHTVAKYGPLVWRTVYRLLNHNADAQDCYQETFLSAWRWAQNRQVEDWPAFLTSLATRRAVDRLRMRARTQRAQRSLDHVAELSAVPVDPLGDVRLGELLERVRVEMTQLPAKQAEVFWLSCVEQLTHGQIAKQIQVSPGEVRVLLHRARARLSESLANECLEERKGP